MIAVRQFPLGKGTAKNVLTSEEKKHLEILPGRPDAMSTVKQKFDFANHCY